jgi:hypothetical protein
VDLPGLGELCALRRHDGRRHRVPARIAYLPVDAWIRAFFGMGLLFSIGSALTLAKTLRDNHEARRLLNRLSEAKTEKIIREFEVNDSTSRAGA